jgi:hypothetical protein
MEPGALVKPLRSTPHRSRRSPDSLGVLREGTIFRQSVPSTPHMRYIIDRTAFSQIAINRDLADKSSYPVDTLF